MLLFIWGFRVRFKTVAEGEFHCPSCGADRHYARKEFRRWFTLFFVPLIPLKVLGERVECTTCTKGFDVEVLGFPTSAALSEQLLAATREAVVQLLRIDGPAAAREAGLRALSEASGTPWSDERLDADLQQIDVSALPPRLRQLSDVMSSQGREHFLTTATMIAAGGGTLADASRNALAAMANELGMTPAHARGVIDQVVESAGR